MSDDHLQRMARPVPRYTSYPTAPHFHGGVGNADYAGWLAAIGPQHSLSLYFHIPFCDTLCWFCGCSTKHTRRYEPVADYLPYLKTEVSAVSKRVASGAEVKTIHWGGGSPTILTPEDTTDLAGLISERFELSDSVEFSVEIDPRGMTADRISALAKAGVTRASIGVQDFNEQVQAAINRKQSFEETRDVLTGLRSAGIASVNFDLIYGLPWQTTASVADTISQVVELRPDRLAVFGYAHVPWMKRHQRLIPDESLPGVEERFRQSQLIGELLEDAGYARIGMDHFALPEDSLSIACREGRLRRNFQGYTDDPADVLLGFGASSIGRLPQGYVHNATPTGQYKELIAGEGLAVTSGYAFQPEDELRAHVIERLICEYEFSCADLRTHYDHGVEDVIDIASDYAATEGAGLVTWDNDTFRIEPSGQPFVRNVCARFDAFLGKGAARHSMSV